MTPLEAIEKYTTEGRFSGVAGDGRKLWSDGHFILPANFSSVKYLDSAGKLWDKHAVRVNERIVDLGNCVKGCGEGVYRELLLNGEVVSRVNEAYRQACQPEGITAHVAAPDQGICFRDASGNLIAIIMPVATYGSTLEVCEPTDEAVWGFYAIAANEFYRQTTEALARKFIAKRTEARSNRMRAQERLEEAKSDIEDYDKEIAYLEDQINELRKRGKKGYE